ncbi:MAG: hypothetical protein SchgKO_15850 [Schleiferiaceae bacterium]
MQDNPKRRSKGLSTVLLILFILALAAGAYFIFSPSPVSKIKGDFEATGLIIYSEMVTDDGTDYYQEAMIAYSIGDSTYWAEAAVADSFSVQYPGNEVILNVKIADTSQISIQSVVENFSANNKQEYVWNADNRVSKITFINSIAFYATYIDEQFAGGFYSLAVLDEDVLTLYPVKYEGLYQENPLPLKVISDGGYTQSLIDEETGQVFL